MTCRELADFILDYLSGELPDEVRGTFEYHLSICPDCVNYVDNYKATAALTRRAFDADDAPVEALSDVPADLVRAILAARRS